LQFRPYNLSVPIDPAIASQKLEEAKRLVDNLSQDIQGFLAMAQMSIPLGESVIRRFAERTDQIRVLFSIREEDRHNG